ncbi:MAG: polysaccharide biosynthesis/export family protein [Verrucomicrobiales bacterium]|nr:polysaccharide biosynthesis/export family protein [Verrucomicrobiota bacterium JB025]
MKTDLMRLVLVVLALVPALVPAWSRGQDEGSSGTISHRDTVEVRVFREDDLTTRAQLSEGGSITMPLIGSVRIVGMSTDRAAQVIKAKLADGYLVKPEVSVSIEARVRRTVTVLGQVKRPGVFRLEPHRQLSLVEAIGMAGGVTGIANKKKITLKRGGSVRVLDLKAIASGRGKDLMLRDGDVVNVPESLF